MIAEAYQRDEAATARHLGWPGLQVRAALNYAAAFPREIDYAIADNNAVNFEALTGMLPQIERFVVPA